MTSMMRVAGNSNGNLTKSSATTLANELIGRNTNNNGRVDTLAVAEQLGQIAQQDPAKAKAVYGEIQRHISQHGSPLDRANLELDLKKELELLDPEIEKAILGSVDESRLLEPSSKTITKTLNYSEIKDRITKLRLEEDPMGTKRTVADALTTRMERMIVATAFELVDKQHIPLEDVARMMNMSTGELEEIIGHQDYLFSDGYDKSINGSNEIETVTTEPHKPNETSKISGKDILDSLGEEAKAAFEFKLKVGEFVISHKIENGKSGIDRNLGFENENFSFSTSPEAGAKIEGAKAGAGIESNLGDDTEKYEVKYGLFSLNTSSDGRAGAKVSINPIPKKYQSEKIEIEASASVDFSVPRTIGEWILPTLVRNAETMQILNNLTGKNQIE